ncbi:hypothetical protein ONZ43_g1878 [Nemania bipapillata]|uniref:Uncharacterized protein n=1 Tax=Nemania bipapillata TaxID=110536 RepID=A0ACC2J2T7_9PEZI|nr:hypothetical protein ONZ43_g1878 [Nemania bipapillata]
MSIPPPKFLPVLLGHGCFLRDGNGHVMFDENGNPFYLTPPTDHFLEMRPSKQAQQFWPTFPGQQIPDDTSLVFLSINVNTDCRRKNLITEVGYTIFDTSAIYNGAKGSRKKIDGCTAPGPRGENVTKFAFSRHYIVRDTASHHPGTCSSPTHVAQPYHFTFRKSEYIRRGQVQRTLEDAFNKAASEGLSQEATRKGDRRAVVLVGWGDGNYHPQIRATKWYTSHRFFQHWDIRQHHLIQGRLFNPTYIACLDFLGIQHCAFGREIGNNTGNHSAFTMQLLIALCFLTEEQRYRLSQGQNLYPISRFPGVESVLARDNRPPGSQPFPAKYIPLMH